MADTVIVFDRTGKPLDELNVVVKRHMKLDHVLDFDRGSFNLPVNDPKATEINLRRNNLIYVTSDQPGIRPWAAIIWYDESRGLQITQDGEYIITLRGAEWLMAQRFTSADEKPPYAWAPGYLAEYLIKIMQSVAPFLPVALDLTNFDGIGLPSIPSWSYANIYETICKLAQDNALYWRIDAKRDWDPVACTGTGNLILTPSMHAKAGRPHSFAMVARTTGGNADEATNLSGGMIYERSKHPFANQVIAYGKTKTKENIEYVADNTASQGEVGIVQTVLPVLTATTVDDLTGPARGELSLCSPRLYVDGELSNVTTFPKCGDVGRVMPDYQGATWLAEKYGNVVRMQVIETNYDPQSNKMAVLLEGMTPDE